VAINLSKNQSINLEKNSGSALSHIRLGAGWGKKKGLFGIKSSVDLDASLVMLSKDCRVIDKVWFSQLSSICGSVVHSGDDRSGGGGANDPNEEIDVYLSKLPAEVEHLAFTINCFSSGLTFEGIPNAFATVDDGDTAERTHEFKLEELGSRSTALVLLIVSRKGNSWNIKASGETCSGRTIREVVEPIKRIIQGI
jgi:tellurium resistance protein TerZ